MRICLILLALGLLAIFMLGGCAVATSGAVATAKTTWTDEGAPTLDKRVVFNSFSLAGSVKVDELTSQRSGDLMMAQASLRSKEGETIDLLYKFEWYDLDNIALYTASANWKPLRLYGRETKTIQGVAPDPRGRTFKLLLRAAE